MIDHIGNKGNNKLTSVYATLMIGQMDRSNIECTLLLPIIIQLNIGSK